MATLQPGQPVPLTASPAAAGTTGGFSLAPAPREVADISLYFLQDEFIKYIFEVRTGGAAITAASKAKSLVEAEMVGESAAITTRDFGIALLEETGFNIGLRLVERYFT